MSIAKQNEFLPTSQPAHVAADSISARMVLARSLFTATPVTKVAAATTPRRMLFKNLIPMPKFGVDDAGNKK